jgi:hypothetical protein
VGSSRVALAGIHRNSANGATSLIVVQARSASHRRPRCSNSEPFAARPTYIDLPGQPIIHKVRHNTSKVVGGLIAAAVIWVLVNGPVEGSVLLVLAPSHGITLADLPVLAALVIAGLLLVLA